MGFVCDLVRWPVIQAPMGGGPGRPELAAAVSNAGGMGFLAAGYKTAGEMLVEISETKRLTDQPFGVNVFVPYAPPMNEQALQAYLAQLESDALAHSMQLGFSEWNDDDWEAKLTGLVQHPVEVVSFAFGCPSREVVSELHGLLSGGVSVAAAADYLGHSPGMLLSTNAHLMPADHERARAVVQAAFTQAAEDSVRTGARS